MSQLLLQFSAAGQFGKDLHAPLVQFLKSRSARSFHFLEHEILWDSSTASRSEVEKKTGDVRSRHLINEDIEGDEGSWSLHLLMPPEPVRVFPHFLARQQSSTPIVSGNGASFLQGMGFLPRHQLGRKGIRFCLHLGTYPANVQIQIFQFLVQNPHATSSQDAFVPLGEEYLCEISTLAVPPQASLPQQQQQQDNGKLEETRKEWKTQDVRDAAAERMRIASELVGNWVVTARAEI
ncbi:hypothetical protein BT69DRAFT_1275998 [Atractiella rhizophila]|nr:hypothetical protein BT69DRAFT_1275998 [Atractiella rhizophila]